MTLEDVAARLEALGNPTRLSIYRWLVRAGPDGLAVGALQSRLGIAPSTLSHHLHQLVAVGLVRQERRATTLLCHAEFDEMSALLGFLSAECCVDAPASRARSA